MNKTSRRWHRILAFSFGGLVALWCLSGCLLLWQDWFRPCVRPDTVDTSATLTGLLSAAHSLYPVDSGSWQLYLPKRADEPVKIIYIANDPFPGPEKPVTLWLDPYRVTILAAGESRPPLLEWCYHFHTTLLLPGSSTSAVAMLASILTVLVVTGLLQRRRRGTDLAAWHSRLGWLSFPGLLTSLVTGLLLLTPQQWWDMPDKEPVRLSVPAAARPMAVEEAVSLARRHLPDGSSLRSLQLPGDPGLPWSLAFHRPGSLDVEPAWIRVWVDPWHRRILRIQPGRGNGRQWFYLIHIGAVLAPLSRMFMTLGGLGPALLTLTGISRWIRRRKRRHGLSTAQNPA